MHPHVHGVLAPLESSRQALCAAVEAVPADKRRERPGPDQWSVAEILEHLSLVDELFTQRMSNAIQAARDQGLAAETADRAPLPSAIVTRMADRVNRRDAPETVVPSGTVGDEEALAALGRAHERLRSVVMAADGLALSQVTHDHPFFGALTIYQWVELTTAHEARHLQQIGEVAGALAATR
jgi:hypothetical protein